MPSPKQSLDRAVQHYQAGNFAQAEAACRQIVRGDPRHAQAWNLLGAIACQSGQLASAAEHFQRAVAAAPGVAAYRNNQGEVLQRLGRHADAVVQFQQAARLAPTRPEGHNSLGAVLRELGRLAEAEASYRRALQLRPAYAEAYYNLGNVLRDLKRPDDAAAAYRRALELQPNYLEAMNNLGALLTSQGKLDEALPLLLRSRELVPAAPEVENNLGTVLRDLDRFEEAAACFRRAVELQPANPEIHNNLGNVYRDLERPEESVACYQRVVQLQPTHFEAHTNLGTTRLDQRRVEEAAACYRRAIEVEPDFAGAHHHLAMALLLAGDYEHGWAEYEWRWKMKGRTELADCLQPRWQGEPVDGRTVMLWAEQGLGDTLQFIRYARLVKDSGATVLVQCPEPLIGVLRTCSGIDQLVAAGAVPPSFDLHAPLLSLPLILRTTLATVPAPVPYLFADAGATERWRRELSSYPEFKVGIVWQGNPRVSQPDCRFADRRRSAPLARFEPLAGLPGVRLFSLQKGYGTEQLAECASWGIVDLGERLNDFTDTAAVMMNLDLIVSVDTSPAHLAGALGRPVWIALPIAGCWRWLLERPDSPWYPTARLFRQPRPGDWESVFARVARELAAQVGA